METSIGEALDHVEAHEECRFVDRNTSLFQVLEIFDLAKEDGISLAAILITHSGGHNQKLLGILTIRDLHRIHKLIP